MRLPYVKNEQDLRQTPWGAGSSKNNRRDYVNNFIKQFRRFWRKATQKIGVYARFGPVVLGTMCKPIQWVYKSM